MMVSHRVEGLVACACEPSERALLVKRQGKHGHSQWCIKMVRTWFDCVSHDLRQLLHLIDGHHGSNCSPPGLWVSLACSTQCLGTFAVRPATRRQRLPSFVLEEGDVGRIAAVASLPFAGMTTFQRPFWFGWKRCLTIFWLPTVFGRSRENSCLVSGKKPAARRRLPSRYDPSGSVRQTAPIYHPSHDKSGAGQVIERAQREAGSTSTSRCGRRYASNQRNS
jgi:hypothetical protein